MSQIYVYALVETHLNFYFMIFLNKDLGVDSLIFKIWIYKWDIKADLNT
jgi:hypothetical protein